MARSILVTLGWFAVVAWIYVVMLGVELDWNLVDWQPGLDLKAGMLLLGALAGLVAAWTVAGATRGRLSQALSLLPCLALLAAGLYVLPPEPITHGFFARASVSPLWYRGARLLVMALPTVFWILRFRR